MENIILLGATGSVGSSVLDIIRTYPKKFSLYGFTSWYNIDKTVALIKEFSPKYVVLKEKHDSLPLLFPNVEFMYGEEGLKYICQISEAPTVVSALLGMNGFIPALETLNHGKKLIIANKEALVSGGKFLQEAVKKYGGSIIPLDSEHLALFDLIRGKQKKEIKELVLTASGGPFLHRDIDASITKKDVLKHPTWTMGASITVGSALMINKGLEVIEAMRLFDLPENQIKVLIHPQSLVHGAINTTGGHWHLLVSPADMRYPALHALFYPETPFEAPFGEYDPTLKSLEFFEPDYNKFPLLALSRQVAREDGLLPTVLCAVMEVVIEQFLNNNIAFHKIPDIFQEIIQEYPNNKNPETEEILIADKKAKILTLERITYKGNDLR